MNIIKHFSEKDNDFDIYIFKIVFEGTVGRNSLGNIAIDDIAMVPGVCPSK